MTTAIELQPWQARTIYKLICKEFATTEKAHARDPQVWLQTKLNFLRDLRNQLDEIQNADGHGPARKTNGRHSLQEHGAPAD